MSYKRHCTCSSFSIGLSNIVISQFLFCDIRCAYSCFFSNNIRINAIDKIKLIEINCELSELLLPVLVQEAMVTGGRRKLHNEELHNLHSSPSIIRMIKSRRMRWAEHVA
jgi:hypothetical protein